jgi:hypothetical protein
MFGWIACGSFLLWASTAQDPVLERFFFALWMAATITSSIERGLGGRGRKKTTS